MSQNDSPLTALDYTELTPPVWRGRGRVARLGAYGKRRAGVMRRFIENGVKDAIEKKVIASRDVSEFDEEDNSGDDDD